MLYAFRRFTGVTLRSLLTLIYVCGIFTIPRRPSDRNVIVFLG